ncbi:MAG TPA: AsmA-like C-terminal domain-containing protein, partial [Nitrospirota bacterium]|nr:AsmA-like C-terminal domain-containing protein [Nitrospirota bacterium]
TVTLQHIDVSLLPRPRLIVRAVGISFRGTLTGTLESAHIYPELLPLLRGRIHIAKVLLERPDLVMEFSEHRERRQEKKRPVPPGEQRAKIASAIASIRSLAPELVAEVDEGRLAVTVDNKQVMFVRGLQARLALPPNGFDIAITGNVDHWGTISASGRFLSTDNDLLEIKGLSLSGGRSSLSDLSGRVSWEKAPSLKITSGRSVIFLQDLTERLSSVEAVHNALKSFHTLKGTINLTSLTYAGQLLHPEHGTIEASGSVANVIVDAAILPGPVKVNSGTFKATMDSVSVTDARAELLDASFVTSILISGVSHNEYSIDVSVTGNTGPATVRWASAKFDLPPKLTLRAPLSLSQTRFRRQKDGKSSLRGTLKVQNGPLVSTDIHWDERELLIKRIDIQDEGSKASITLHRRGKLLDVSFAGSIHEQTLNRLFDQSSFRHGWIQGDLKAHVALDRPQESAAEGSLEGKDLLIPWTFKTPLEIKSIRLSARDKTVTIGSSDLTLANTHFTLAGTVTASARQYIVDGDIGASTVVIDTLQKALEDDAKPGGPGAKPDGALQKKPLPLQGTLRCKVDNLSYGKFVLNPVQATVVLAPDEIRVDHLEATFCGITVRGGLSLAGGDISVGLKPDAKGLQLEPALTCLAGKDVKISGVFDLSGTLSARGKPDALVSSLQGSAEFTAREGHFYRSPTLAKILSLLNVSDLLRGNLSDFRAKGLSYRSISIRAGIRSGKLDLQELVIDSSAMNIVGQGVIDLKDSTVSMTVLVAPFTTVDKIVSKIPVVNYILEETLVSIPVTMSGRISDPEVKFMPASAVGDGVLGILKRTLKAPVKIIEPVLPGERKKEGASDPREG